MPSGVEVAQAYITIIPSMRGIQGTIAKELNAEKVGGDAGKKLGDGMAKGAKKSSDALMKSFSSTGDRIAFKTRTGLETAFSNVAKTAQSKMGGAAKAITSRFKDVGSAIAGSAIGNAFTKVSGTIRGVAQFAGDAFRGVAGTISGHLAPIAEKAKPIFDRVGTIAKGAFDKIVATAKVAGAAAAAGLAVITKTAIDSYSQYEQLAGGAELIFSKMDYGRIEKDAYDAYRTMGISANQYLESINQVGAAFKANMGDQQAYETAQKGMQAISDYASGTGRNLDELNEKYALITRSTSSYQSIADQFSGILPATSADFLEQAQAAGLLSDKYTKLTEVPIAEYQQAVTDMMERGTQSLGLAGNTAREAEHTISGSIGMLKASWSNFTTDLARGDADLGTSTQNLVDSAIAVVENVGPRVAQVVGAIFDQMPAIIQTQGPRIAAALGGMLDTVTNGGFSKAVSAVKPYIDRIGAAASGLWDRLKPLAPVVQEIGSKLGGILMTALGAAAGAFEHVAPVIATIAEHALPILSSAVGAAGSAFSAAVSLMGPVASFLTDTLGAAVDWIGQRIEDLAELVEGAFGAIGDAAGAVGDFLSDPLGSIKDFASGAKKAFTGTADTAEKSSKKAASSAGKNYGKLRDDVTKSTKTAASKGASNMNRLATDVGSKTSSAASKANANMGKLASSVSSQTGKAASSAESNGSRISKAWNKSYTTNMTAKANTSGAETTMSNFKKRWSGFGVSGSASLSTKSATDTLSAWKRRNNGFTITGNVNLRMPNSGVSRQYKADGGIVKYRHADGFIATRETAIGQHVVGEAGAEAIVPLTNKRYVAPFARAVADFVNEPRGGVTITGNTFVVRKDSDIQAIGRAINQEAERRRRAKL